MRKLKFRIFFYDGDNYETGYFINLQDALMDDIVEVNKATLLSFDRCSIINQFTGLKDKRGKEIYEGDILRGGAYLSYEVKWDYEENGWNINPYGINSGEFEVIGNIYENPELL